MKIEIDPEITKMTEELAKMQKQFISAYTKLEEYLKSKGFDSKDATYDWNKNVGKMTQGDMIILSHFNVVYRTIQVLNEAQNALGIAMKTKQWTVSDINLFIRSIPEIIKQVEKAFQFYAKKPSDLHYYFSSKISEA